MHNQHLYVREKLDAIERDRKHHPATAAPRQRQPRVLGPVARAAGRRVRRLGEALEAWAAPQAPQDASA